MNAVGTFFEPAARVALAALFDSLWEAALLVLVLWAVLRIFPNVNATTRYAAWCTALIAAVILPLATAVPQISIQQPVSSGVSGNASHSLGAARSFGASRSFVPHDDTNGVILTTGRTANAPAERPRANARGVARPLRLRFALPQSVALPIFGLWVAAALFLLVRLALNLYKLEALKRDALPIAIDYRDQLRRWNLAEKGGRDVRLCSSEHIDVPVAVGLFDSMVLIPRQLLDRLSQTEIDQITLHELAHLRRADDWTNGLQRIIQAIFFFNPAILLIAQQLDLEREIACDDWVLRQIRDVRPYASCLTRMAEVTAWPHRALAAPGVFVTRRGLSVRVERLLRAGRNVRTSVAFGPAGVTAAAMLALAFVAQNVAPSFAFTTTERAPAHHTALALATATPQPLTRVQTITRTRTTTRTATKYITVKRYIDVPAMRVHVPATHVHVPAIRVSIPPMNVDVPAVSVHIPARRFPIPMVSFPPGYFDRISRTASRAATRSVNAARIWHTYQIGTPIMSARECIGCDFSRQNLAGHDFHGQRLTGTDFSRANLENANFSNSSITGGDFSYAKLRGATFRNARLTGCDFSHSDLTNVDFTGVHMIGCDISATSLSPAQARALLFGCQHGCDFSGLSGVSLRGQDLHGLTLSGVDLQGVDLRDADLSGGTFYGVDFENARFDGARLNGTTFKNCDLDGASFHGVDLSHVRFIGSTPTMR